MERIDVRDLSVTRSQLLTKGLQRRGCRVQRLVSRVQTSRTAHSCTYATARGVQSSNGNAWTQQLLIKLISLMFSIKPVWNAARSKARQKIAARGDSIGVNQAKEIKELKASVSDWDAVLQDTVSANVQYPAYYAKPFHAYDEGNLSWEAAFQFPSTTKLVHAPVMDPVNKDLQRDGDQRMRQSYSEHMLASMRKVSDVKDIRRIIDLGCAAGLSTAELHRVFPEASITGIDLSPYFLSVGKVLQQKEGKPSSKVDFVHGQAEATGLPSESADLVSMCLMLHELPQTASIEILTEAFRLLKPGGFLSIMEMDPLSPRFQQMFANPFAFVPFKATEPWLEEYINLDLKQAAVDVGFTTLSQESSTPAHFTFVAQKSA